HVRDLAGVLRGQGVDAIVLAGGGGGFAEQLKARGIPFYCLRNLHRSVGPFRAFQTVMEIRRLLQDLRPDLVSTHSTTTGLLGRLAPLRFDMPVLFSVDRWGCTDGRPGSPGLSFGRGEWAAAPLAARIITVCASDLHAAVRTHLTRQAWLVAIPNAMPGIS